VDAARPRRHDSPVEQLLDTGNVVVTVVALVPNLMLILWAMARLSRDVRILYAKLSLLEGELRLVDQGLNAVSEQMRRPLAPVDAPPKPPGPEPGGGSW